MYIQSILSPAKMEDSEVGQQMKTKLTKITNAFVRLGNISADAPGYQW